MATAILTVGVLFSGKTTYAEQLVESDPSYVIISRDDFRFNMFPSGHKFTQEDEAAITSRQYDMIRECHLNNKNIIITNSNLRMMHLRKFIRILERYNYDIKLKLFEMNTEVITTKMQSSKIRLNPDHIERQQELYKTIKEKLVTDQRYSKYIMP